MSGKNGFVIAQFPNKWLWIMIITWPLSYFLTGDYAHLTKSVFYVVAVIWAYEEIVRGVNWFRNLLGVMVMVMVIAGIAGGLKP